ncbi:GntR family transcriptional regulator [Agrobacterium larrymoorei]|uniref:GntR family transcriptional regulator n=1 Tax=Agrobacterium larrymoorei TaxID=160699 RepID=UPI001573E77C|nr:GntR family transcriptional regulator [Agrobacterium larrymoorei]NTJ43889.1 GntR family transcriptional regulator [Agrobacterium larrymoorei]
MARKQTKPKPVTVDTKPKRANRVNFIDLAYERIEELLINCELKPGSQLTLQELQEATGLGRTPVHNAVSKLAADTLFIVLPRHGLRVAPIDLARERLLLQLRRDMERFVVRLAVERASLSHRNQMLQMERALKERRDQITLSGFNALDRRINQILLAAANEPFLEHTLRPLHTIYRRIGFIHHTISLEKADLSQTVDCHLSVLNAVANRHLDTALSATDALIGFVDSMFDEMEKGIDPRLLDCSIEPIFKI